MKNNVELADYYFLNYRQSVYVANILIEFNGCVPPLQVVIMQTMNQLGGFIIIMAQEARFKGDKCSVIDRAWSDTRLGQ